MSFPPKNEQKQVDLRYHISKVEFVSSFLEESLACKNNFLEESLACKNHDDFVWPLQELRKMDCQIL